MPCWLDWISGVCVVSKCALGGEEEREGRSWGAKKAKVVAFDPSSGTKGASPAALGEGLDLDSVDGVAPCPTSGSLGIFPAGLGNFALDMNPA